MTWPSMSWLTLRSNSTCYPFDSVGRFNPSAFLSGLTCLAFWFFAKALVYTFLSGSFVAVVSPYVAQISDLPQMGTKIGMLYSFIPIL